MPKFHKLENHTTVNFISKQFSNLFSSYTQSLNAQIQRRGTLFEKPFRRNQIDNMVYFKNLIHYIHFNPVHHRFVDDLRDWQHSSYQSFFSEKSSSLKRKEAIAMFGDKKLFFDYHKNEIDGKMVLDLELD